MPGLVALVSRDDDVHVEAIGTMAIGHSAPMKRDTIFRIASLTKAYVEVDGKQHTDWTRDFSYSEMNRF